MARPKTFNEAEALERMAAIFLEHGYEATSVRDLIAGVGISSSSFYATFGDKRQVYGAALEHYLVIERQQLTALFAGSSAIRPTLIEMFTGLIDVMLADGKYHGLLTLDAIDLGGRDPAIAAQLRTHYDDISELLAARLAAAQAKGEICNRHTALDLARYLLFGLFGLAMMMKIYPDRTHLERTTGLVLAILDN